MNQRLQNITSDGTRLGLSYYGFDPLYLSYSLASHSYNIDIDRIDELAALPRLIGDVTYDQFFAFEDERQSVEIGYYFSSATLALNRGEGQSAVDQSIQTSTRILVDFQINNDWAAGFVLGRSKLDISDEVTRFGSVNLSRRW